MRYFRYIGILITLGVLSCFASTRGEKKEPVGIIEKLGKTIKTDAEVYDEKGNLVTVKSILHKPTILTFVYFKCAGICSPLLTEVTKVINKTDLQLGKDYQIVTISFDPDETPELASAKRQNYLNELSAKSDSNGWHFYTADSATIQQLTSSAGFYFERNGAEWLHAGALIVLSPDGKVSRYMYGLHHLPFDVKLALLEASEGRTGPTIAKVLEFCYSYDPEGNTYALNVTRISMVVVLGFVGLFVIVLIIRPKRKTSSTSASTTDKQ